MTQEVLKLALDALEDFSHKACYDNGEGEIGSRVCCEVLSYKAHDENCKVIKAITAIQEALAQEQEPVAWRTFDGEGGYDYRSYEDNESYADDWSKRNPNHVEWVDKLYTHPQRTWVGLTDVEIDYLLGSTAGENEETHISFARAIEAKLKERNDHGI